MGFKNVAPWLSATAAQEWLLLPVVLAFILIAYNVFAFGVRKLNKDCDSPEVTMQGDLKVVRLLCAIAAALFVTVFLIRTAFE